MNNSTFKRLLKLIKPYYGLLFLSILCALIAIASSLYSPIVIGEAIDILIGKNEVKFSDLYQKIYILIGLALANAVFLYLMYFIVI